jgi:CRP-like cAMP-binding protein
MIRLGMDKLDVHEQAEFNAGLGRAEQSATLVLEGFLDAGVLSKGAFHHIRDDISRSLETGRVKLEKQESERNAYLSLLQAELETLDMLYKAGVIPQYTRIDIRQEIQSERDRLWSGGSLQEILDESDQIGLFARFEQFLLGKVRELDWLSRQLMRYQYMRLSQHFRRDVARLMMTESSIRALKADESISSRVKKMLLDHLRERCHRLEASLSGYKRDMPDFYRRYSHRIASEAAWFGALAEAGLLFHHGQMGGKSHVKLRRILQKKMESLSSLLSPVPKATAHELVSMVPLFSTLPKAAVKAIVGRATTVTFLPGDRVIGQGEKGDALYIVVHGMLRVHRTNANDDEDIGLLEDGDFFGEMALLGDHVRNVNVTAMHACELIRIKRDDVLALAKKFPQIEAQLQSVSKQRRQNSSLNQ